jgi:hypothetical protein
VDAVNILLDNTQFGLSVESPTTSAAGCAMMTPLACAAVAGQVRERTQPSLRSVTATIDCAV